jgi:hypothetical protein
MTRDYPFESPIVAPPRVEAVTVIGSHADGSRPCRAHGLIFPDGRLLIAYPFHWTDDRCAGAEVRAPINLCHVEYADGQSLPHGWRDIGPDALTPSDCDALRARITELGQWPSTPSLPQGPRAGQPAAPGQNPVVARFTRLLAIAELAIQTEQVLEAARPSNRAAGGTS